MDERKQCFMLLNDYRYKLTSQQRSTFKGQILKGEYDAFRRGLFKLMMVKYLKKGA
jgi:hypothetical protein